MNTQIAEAQRLAREWKPNEDGIAALDRGDYAEALRLLWPLAEQGDAEAQFRLGKLYVSGRGVQENYSLAEKWYRMAGEQGNADAQYGLAALLQERNKYTEATKWYKKAAAQGDRDAAFSLANIYAGGFGAPRHLFDLSKSAHWFEKAAELGFIYAAIPLSGMYADGRGVNQDIVKAHMWLDIAISAWPDRQYRTDAIKQRDALTARMTTAQIAEAQRLAREWKPKK